MYSKEDERVLLNFFTNLDKPIFGAKNFHPEVWALMQARYSRSTEGMRESFLNLLKEDPANYEELKKIVLSDKQETTDVALKKAISFMEKWVLGYGHSSVSEGAVVGFGLEGVSILASKVIEDNRLCSFIEKSTRYVSFGRNSFLIPKELQESKHKTEVEDLFDSLFQTYMDLHEPVLEYVQKTVPLTEGVNEAAWKRSTAARRFDSVRYLLPASTKTSLGWTVNARQLAHAINKLLSHPLSEMREIGVSLQGEGSQLLPSLLKYTGEKTYFKETEKDMRIKTKLCLSNTIQPGGEKVCLVSSPEDSEEKIIAAILFRYSNVSFEDCLSKARALSDAEKEEVFEVFLQKQEAFDSPLRELEHSDFVFEVMMDYGAFRDIQRHRLVTQTNQLLTCFHGFETPPDIIGAGAQKKYAEVMNHAKEVFEKVWEEDNYSAQYVVPLAYKHRFLIKGNLREFYYLIKLRSQPQGHFSYVELAKKMHSILSEKYPIAMKHCICAQNLEELGRLKAEERLERKIKRREI
ncbi:MAG: FAD-dependent thymidylate synthase [Candidatus Micrarchaeota archaeon]